MDAQLANGDVSNAERHLSLREGELRLKEGLLEYRRERLAAEREAASKSGQRRDVSPLAVTILTAFFTVLGGLIGAYVQGAQNLGVEREKFQQQINLDREKFRLQSDMERQKAQGDLILKAIETGDPKKAKENVLFLIKTHLLNDQKGYILAYYAAKSQRTGPSLPAGWGSSPSIDIETMNLKRSMDKRSQQMDRLQQIYGVQMGKQGR